MELDILQKRSIFKALATKSQLEVATEFGLDKYYKNVSTRKMKINQIYREVAENPELYTISPDILEIVEKAMSSRKPKKDPGELIEVEKVNEKQLVVGAGKKAWILLNKKLDFLAENPRAFANESLINIAKIAGIAFDKSQIVKGEATENIALRAQIDQNITPEEAVAQLMRFRESAAVDE